MILEIPHETTFSHAAPAREWLCELLMKPASDRGQRRHSFHIATRTLDRLPTLEGHADLAPLDAPVHTEVHAVNDEADGEQQQQQQH